MSSRTRVPSPALYGWPSDVTVEVERDPRSRTGRNVYAVYVNGEHVGYVYSRQETRRRTAWDVLTVRQDAEGPTARWGLCYSHGSRPAALVALVERVRA